MYVDITVKSNGLKCHSNDEAFNSMRVYQPIVCRFKKATKRTHTEMKTDSGERFFSKTFFFL